MDGLNYDDIEKMLESQAWRKRHGETGRRQGGRYLDVVRPGAEMKKKTPTRQPVVVEEAVVAAITEVPPAVAEKIEESVEKLEDDIEAIAGQINDLIIEEEVAPTTVTETFLNETPNPFLPDAIERVVKRPLGPDVPETPVVKHAPVPSRKEPAPVAVNTTPEKKPEKEKKSEKSRGLRAIYAKDKVSDALTKDVDSSLEREVEAALNEKPKKARRKGGEEGNNGLLIFCIALIIVFGAVAGFLVYYLFFK